MFCARFIYFTINDLQRNRRVKLPARILFGKTEINGTDREVRMLAARDVWNDEHHPTNACPPGNMDAHLRCAKEAVEQTRNRHERVGAISKTKCLTQQTRADMHDDEDAHYERIFFLPAIFYFLIQQNVVAIFKPFIFGYETTYKENGNAQKQKTTHDIGNEIEGVDDTCGQKREGEMFAAVSQLKTRKESFKHIDKIHEGIRD